MRSTPRVVAGGIAAFMLVLGLWAFFSPTTFYERVAGFPPYNRHFLHDVGAFQMGIGATLAAALVWSDALLVALAGTAVGTVVHFISHVIDRDLGGRATDPIGLGLLAGVVVAAALLRARHGPPG